MCRHQIAAWYAALGAAILVGNWSHAASAVLCLLLAAGPAAIFLRARRKAARP